MTTGAARVPGLRTALARGVSLTRADRPLRALAGRAFGGYVLAFHEVDAPRFRELVAALAPDRPVHLDELVDRIRRGQSTANLFAITVDDGVGTTVRALADAAVAMQWPITFFLPTRYLDTGAGMPFQWLDALLAAAPRTVIQSSAGRVDLGSDAARAAFDARMRRVAYTRPLCEYGPLIAELAEHARRQGWLAEAARMPPAPIGWQEVAALATRDEIRFESHGVTHTAVCALTPPELEAELSSSRERIAEHTGRAARHFCYPYGGAESIGRHAPRVVARYYDSAVTMSRGRVARRDPHLLPRIPFYPRDDGDVARLKLLTR